VPWCSWLILPPTSGANKGRSRGEAVMMPAAEARTAELCASSGLDNDCRVERGEAYQVEASA